MADSEMGLSYLEDRDIHLRIISKQRLRAGQRHANGVFLHESTKG